METRRQCAGVNGQPAGGTQWEAVSHTLQQICNTYHTYCQVCHAYTHNLILTGFGLSRDFVLHTSQMKYHICYNRSMYIHTCMHDLNHSKSLIYDFLFPICLIVDLYEFNTNNCLQASRSTKFCVF